ncbi:MAG TPA: FAD-dependent oxidoreductase [Bacteroides sp.]|nr:FAD-dependent oxidoreductase [Bacteroides sp.]
MRKYIILLMVLVLGCRPPVGHQEEYDLVIYGGTSAGIVAAVQAVRMEKSVLVVNPGTHIGGLTTGGLGQTDIGNKQVIGGISREFYRRIRDYYEDTLHWEWETRADYRDGGQTRTLQGEDAMWTFEPKAAMRVFNDLITEYGIPIIRNQRISLQEGVVKENGKIKALRLESGRLIRGKMFMDATYEGDLMAVSGVSYTTGREAVSEYGESLNGVQTKMAVHHQFEQDIDPYVVPGDTASGLLPGIFEDPGEEGSGDRKVQAYCFRMCLTDVPENRILLRRPGPYNEQEYELLFRALEQGYSGPFFIMSMMPNRKTDANNNGCFSSDFIGRNYEYPEGDYKKRGEIIRAHRNYQLGLLWTLANHPRVPEEIRAEWQQWGLPADEFTDNGHWTPQLYIREARRMVSDFVMTQHHCTQESASARQSVGMGAYTMDSHHVQRYVNEQGFVKNEGDVQVGGFSPYPIEYRSIIPKREECTNLLVPVCLSATHIAFGSIRMEPVFMVLAQSAATAACLAINEHVTLQDLDYMTLRERLIGDEQVLSFRK